MVLTGFADDCWPNLGRIEPFSHPNGVETLATLLSNNPPHTPSGITFDKPSVAALSREDILAMSQRDLVEAVRGSELPTLNAESMAHVEFLEPDALRRLLFLARECCRHQGY